MTQQNAMEMIQTGQLGRIKPSHGYYRQSNGWITVDVVTELEELAYRREGWEPLPQYGTFDMAGVYAANHPLELLFLRGGAKELPLDQVIGSGFHLQRPLIPSCGMALMQYHKGHSQSCWANAKPVHFPQLDDVDWEDFEREGYQCRFCDRQPFPTAQARDQHAGVMHKDKMSDIRTGETLAEALVRGLNPQQQAQAQTAEEWVPDPSKPYLCGYCIEGFASPVQLGKHVKAEHKSIEGAGDDGEQVEG